MVGIEHLLHRTRGPLLGAVISVLSIAIIASQINSVSYFAMESNAPSITNNAAAAASEAATSVSNPTVIAAAASSSATAVAEDAGESVVQPDAAVDDSSKPLAVIFMHGLGDHGSSWEDLPHILTQSTNNNIFLDSKVKWLFPDAPQAPVSCNAGYVMPSWFDLEEIPVKVSSKDDEEGITKSAQKIHQLIHMLEEKAGIPPSRVIVGGFSQGALTAFMAGLLFPTPLRGIVMLSGWAPMREKVAQLKANEASTPLFFGHGESDSTVEFQLGKESATVAAAAGFNVEFKSYPGLAHSTSGREMRDLAEWMAKLLN